MKLRILLWLILITLNILMWQWVLSTRVQFETLPSYDIDKGFIVEPFSEEIEKV